MTGGTAGPLAGIRALDLTTNFVAYAGKLLADLGAEVIRIEPPTGDPVRKVAPYIATSDGRQVSAAHEFLNTSKKSVTLDLKCPEGRDLFQKLVVRSDLVIENFAPGQLAAMGVGYDQMREWNPQVILVSITPYGQEGPRSAAPATDLTLLAAGGLLSLGGYVDTGPIAIPGCQTQFASAIFGTVSALSALLERGSTSRGKWIDVAGQECIAFALEDAIPEWYLNNSIRQRTGERAREAGTGVYPCKDGYISMVAGRLGTAKAFATLAQWVASELPGGEDLLEERWQDFKYRQSEDGICRFETVFNQFCASRGKQELYREGQARQIAIAPVNTVADVLENEQLNANGFFKPHFDAEIGREIVFPGPPYNLSRTPAAVRSLAPPPGSHNREVLIDELGVSESQFATLSAAGVV